jgi:hypothetical protein
MQYQYGEQRDADTKGNWKTAQEIQPGDWLVAWLPAGQGMPSQFLGIGQVRRPRLAADHVGSISASLQAKSHAHADGVVHYSDAPAFYENLRFDNGFNSAWGQRLDVEEWALQHEVGLRPPPGFEANAMGFMQKALVEIKQEYFDAIRRELKMSNPLEAVLDDAAAILNVIPQIILQGPPGTGKTYAAKRLAARLLNIGAASVDMEERGKRAGEFHAARLANDAKDKCWELVQFHPAYSYDDFIRGIQAKPDEHSINYAVVPRVLDKLVRHHEATGEKAVLIVDEINRANVAQVLGELIYGLEYRGSEIETPYEIDGKSTLRVPEGLYVIGTMNTADRSIGRIDYAVRRRFAFLQLNPDRSVLTNQNSGSVPEPDSQWAATLFDAVEKLFATTSSSGGGYLAPEFHRDEVQVGHTYFLGPQEKARIKFAYQVWPLLREYYKDGVLARLSCGENSGAGVYPALSGPCRPQLPRRLP